MIDGNLTAVKQQKFAENKMASKIRSLCFAIIWKLTRGVLTALFVFEAFCLIAFKCISDFSFGVASALIIMNNNFLNIFWGQFCSTANVQLIEKAKKKGFLEMNENIFTVINYMLLLHHEHREENSSETKRNKRKNCLRSKLWPSFPSAPLGPVSPRSPCGPIGPGGPGLPIVPWSPFSPTIQ